MIDYKIEEIRERHEMNQPQPGAEDIAILLDEVDRLRAELALEQSGFVLKRMQVEKLRSKINELMRSSEMFADQMRKESDRADEAWAEVDKLRAEVEALNAALRRRDTEMLVAKGLPR